MFGVDAGPFLQFGGAGAVDHDEVRVDPRDVNTANGRAGFCVALQPARQEGDAALLGESHQLRVLGGVGLGAFDSAQRTLEVILFEFCVQRGDWLLPHERHGAVDQRERPQDDQQCRERAQRATATAPSATRCGAA